MSENLKNCADDAAANADSAANIDNVGDSGANPADSGANLADGGAKQPSPDASDFGARPEDLAGQNLAQSCRVANAANADNVGDSGVAAAVNSSGRSANPHPSGEAEKSAKSAVSATNTATAPATDSTAAADSPVARCWLTFFGAGLCPKAPGTAGSLAGAAVAAALLAIGDAATLIMLSILIMIISIKIIDRYEATHEHDASEIVIDEVCGVFAAIGIALAGAAAQGLALHRLGDFAPAEWALFASAVVLFRVFDILKPSVIGRIDRGVPGGWGVMGDDLAAGIIAGLAAVVGYGVYLKFVNYL